MTVVCIGRVYMCFEFQKYLYEPKNKHSPVIIRFSKHKILLDFGFKKQTKKFFKKFEKDSKTDINSII